MTPISYNESKTVGICEGYNQKSDFIGRFRAGLLKEWAQWILDNLVEEPDTDVYLYNRKSMNPDNTARILAASEKHGDEIMVVLCGVDNDDILGGFKK